MELEKRYKELTEAIAEEHRRVFEIGRAHV